MTFLLYTLCLALMVTQAYACHGLAGDSCPPDWYLVGPYCYQLSKVMSKSLEKAQETCKDLQPAGSHPPAVFTEDDWRSVLGFLLYKSGEYPHDSVKFWLALTSRALPQQNWVWMKRAPLNWTNWDTPVPPAIKYEILDPHYHENYNTCGVGWAQKSTQTSGWLNTKCTSDNSYGEVITICQRKPNRKRFKPTNFELTVKQVDTSFGRVKLKNGKRIRLDVSRKELEQSNMLINKIGRLVARKMYGNDLHYKPSQSPVKGDSFVPLHQLQKQYAQLLDEMGEVDESFANSTKFSKHKRGILPQIEKWSTRRNITYQYDAKFPKNGTQWKVFDKALNFWQSHTCFNFSVADRPDVIFLDGGGCYSTVGKASYDAPQAISMGENCETFAIATHEIGHMLGLDHMQNRPDRDKFVDVFLPNVNSTYIDNFRTCCDCGSRKPRPYDYGSVMHYSATEFTVTGGTTVLPKEEHWWRTIGTSHEPSFWDVKTVNEINCRSFCKGANTTCDNGGYPHPRNCSICICPQGFAGPTCADFDDSRECGGYIEVTKDFVNITSPNYPSGFRKADCLWMLKAPPGSKINIRFEKKFFDLPENCYFGYVEIKDELDLTISGKRFCGTKAPEELTSKGNVVIMILRTFLDDLNFGFGARVKATTNGNKGKRAVPLSRPQQSNKQSTRLSCAFVSGSVRNAGPAGLSLRADNE